MTTQSLLEIWLLMHWLLQRSYWWAIVVELLHLCHKQREEIALLRCERRNIKETELRNYQDDSHHIHSQKLQDNSLYPVSSVSSQYSNGCFTIFSLTHGWHQRDVVDSASLRLLRLLVLSAGYHGIIHPTVGMLPPKIFCYVQSCLPIERESKRVFLLCMLSYCCFSFAR